jgi:DNA-binding CsgD family transcriptional regulator
MTHVTPRESDVLALLKIGDANKTIAHKLGLSESTVKVHVRKLMRKARATNRSQTAMRLEATSIGVQPLPEWIAPEVVSSRTVVQIAATEGLMVLALCNDGSMWWAHAGTNSSWQQMPAVPVGDGAAL